MAVDPQGRIEVILPADADGRTTHNWFYKQTSGPRMQPGAVNGNGTGNQTWVFEDDHGKDGGHGGEGADRGKATDTSAKGGGGGGRNANAHSIRSS
jgi:hypothetical protein